jgi:hypothetical protein
MYLCYARSNLLSFMGVAIFDATRMQLLDSQVRPVTIPRGLISSV